MWQLFTERARRVILLGQEEAGKMNSGHVGTEHLLLGLVREDEGVAAQILQRMGVSLPQVRAEVDLGGEPDAPHIIGGEPKLTPKAKRVLELAADEARRMRHNYIGTEHLLLALLREKDGLAAQVLRRLGLNLEKARSQVMEYLGPAGEAPVSRDVSPTELGNDLEPEEGTASLAPDLPEAQMQANLTQFVRNLNAGTAFPANTKFVFGARRGYFGANEWNDDWNEELLQHQIAVQRISIDTADGEDAQISVSYCVVSAMPRKTAQIRETNERGWTEILALKLGDFGSERLWQIVPGERFPLPSQILEPPYLAQAAFVLAQKADAGAAPDEAEGSLQNLKQLALAALQFSADWDDTFAFAPQYAPSALAPYLRSNLIWEVPGAGANYEFNGRLCEQNVQNLANRTQTVLFYDGQDEKLAFRHDGKAAVAFVDGRCALVSEEEAERLIWKA